MSDLSSALLIRCVSGNSAERDIICRAAAEIARLQDDLKMLKLKAENAKARAVRARDEANLAIEYAIDCETLVARMLAPAASTAL